MLQRDFFIQIFLKKFHHTHFNWKNMIKNTISNEISQSFIYHIAKIFKLNKIIFPKKTNIY